MYFDIFQILILFASFQGVIFGVVILCTKKYKGVPNVYIAMTFLTLSISNILHIFFDTLSLGIINLLRELYLPFHWLVIPFLYAYVKSFLGIKHFSKKELLFLAGPFVFVLLLHFFQFLYKYQFDNSLFISKYYESGLFLWTNLISFLHTFIVLYNTYNIVPLQKGRSQKAPISKPKIKWLKKMIMSGAIIGGIGFVSAVYLLTVGNSRIYVTYPFFISISLWVYTVGYINLVSPIGLKSKKIKTIITKEEKKGLGTFYEIDLVVKNKKYYLNALINLQSIAEEFNISSGYLSQLVNLHAKKSFTEYINSYRIEASKKMLLDNTYKNYTIEAIGLECGFKSKSNFYAAFKKEMGITPTQYKKTG